MENKCLCCFTDLKEKNSTEYNSIIDQWFLELTGFKLKQYDHSLNLICLFCYKDLKKCKEFRDLVIRNQQKDWHKSEIGDPLEDFVKVENTDTLNSIVPEKLTVQPSAAKTQKQRKQCPICGIFVINLPEHEKIVHQSIRRFFCDYCQYSCFFKTKIQRHIQRHIPKSFRKNFPCEVQGCSFSASRKDALRSHALTKHQTSRRKNCLCIECGKRFYNNSQLNIHQKAVHEKLKNHLCTLCGKTFFNSKDMEIHQLRHGVKDQECTTCGNLFYCSLDLKRHIKTHADPVIPCQAKDCKKQFYTISKAKTHFKIKHEGAKDYFCDYCSSRFSQQNNLKRHINSVHKSLRIRCPILGCSYSVARKDKYKNHLASQHKFLDDLARDSILTNVKFE